MNRRDMLRLTGAAGTLAVAGCLGGDGDESDGEAESDDDGDEMEPTPTETPTPEETENSTDDESDGTADGSSGEYEYEDPVQAVEAFVQAFEEGDVEGANTLVYDDGRVEPVPEDTSSEELRQNAPEIVEIVSSDVTGGLATVETQLRSAGSDSAVPTTFQLTEIDGAWRISGIDSEPPESQTPESQAPRASFDFDFEDGTGTITLEAGDSILAGELYVRGDGVEPTGVWHELAEDSDLGPDDEVGAGMSVTIDVEDEYDIRVVWESKGQSATLSSVSGASESESPSGSELVAEYLSDVGNYDGTIEDFTGDREITVVTGEVAGVDQRFAFSPPAIRIESGTTVTWEWAGEADHSVTHQIARNEERKFDSERQSGDGTTFSHTFEDAGTYLYYCVPHRALGMKGAVVVE